MCSTQEEHSSGNTNKQSQMDTRNNMTAFWEEHSKDGTVEEMMLDSRAKELTQHELPEILSLLPCLTGSRVLELGAGIGRYTSPLLTLAGHVTAVDFMESFVERNRQDNGHHSNATFLQADVTKLDMPKNSIDFIFSNWLLMYLTDEELQSFAEKMMGWLRPGGLLFFRESCNHRSGDFKRDFNPTCYRTEAQYNHLVTSMEMDVQEGGQKFGFDIVLKKKVQTYVQIKNNQNQICWLLEKVPRSPGTQNGFNTFQQFLDNQQYSNRNILRYEKMFGAGYVSTGGPSTTKEFVDLLNLKPGQKVLDVGCGIGGGDFYMAKNFGVEVLGLDLSDNMVDTAIERAVTEKLPSVQFEVADATKRSFPDASFDVIYSRDTILHIDDKLTLFKRFHFIQEAGFCNVRSEDRTAQFMQVIKTELQRAELIRDEFMQEFSEEDYLAIVKGWREKLERSNSGDQRWGLFYATKD
ncbi:phosphoethanolamine N-methyltransferase 3-like isoform X4 [Gymnodraco acuticeps]|uniref:phosphoethanolamine N-methyltransferase n=1 Tax=Gymnodraco acuticeps TaxID=8218 RepID=A0A6P8V8S0_GYMAC|nr:phosphoethanolamine N-methyltransferase 3-like isoform X4 [Gymnodraco acuticeps]